MALQNETKQNQLIGGDRRNDRRYQVALDLRWKLIRRRKVLSTGEGRTVDLSSGGVFFDSGRVLPVGLDAELSIAWPIRLNNVAPLQLVVSGRIVRTSGNMAAIRIVQREFRTMGSAEPRRTDAPGQPAVLTMSSRMPSTGTYEVRQ
jgi:hypothetical protein